MRSLIDEEKAASGNFVSVALLTIAVGLLILAVARVIRRVTRRINRRLQRFAPRPVAQIAGVLVVAVVLSSLAVVGADTWSTNTRTH